MSNANAAYHSIAHPGAHAPRPLAWLRHALEVRRERAVLARLDADDLDDLGLSRQDVWGEHNRPFWELPDNRRW